MSGAPRAPVGPLNHAVPIVDAQGRPTPEFIRKWAEQRVYNGDIAAIAALVAALETLVNAVAADVAALEGRQIIAGPGLTGGGPLTADVTLQLEQKDWQPQGFVNGKATASYVIFNLVTKAGYTLPTGLAGSLFEAGVAATASTVYDLFQNATLIGTLSWAAAGTVPTVTFAAPVVFAEGDNFSFVASAAPDATLADISFLFLGTRPV